jgi:hypothetical protein
MRVWIAISIVLLCWADRGAAWAQNAAEKAAADTLFLEGKKLITAGDTEAACPKFEASLAKLEQLGTQLALASCYEKLGKTASAWGAFRAAASTARKARDVQRQRFAEEHADALEAKLSRLVIKVEPGYRIDGLAVKRDGMEVLPAELGSPVPVDPGEHIVEAHAPGWNAWSQKVAVTMPGVVEVIVPALGKAPVKVEEPQAPPPPPLGGVQGDADQDRARRTRRILAYGIGGGGIAVLGTSLILGAVASSRWSDAQSHCRDNLCDQTGVDLASGARSMGNASTALFVVGTAAVTAGVYLLLTAPKSGAERAPAARAARRRIVPEVGSTQLGLSLQGEL